VEKWWAANLSSQERKEIVMDPLREAKEPFIFSIQAYIPELTGLKASNLQQLLDHIKTVPDSVIYHHTHHFLQEHQYLSPEPPNDFAYWVTEFLHEVRLGESLLSIDTIQYTTIRELRNEIIRTLEAFIEQYPTSLNKFVLPGEEFHFLKSANFILQTPYKVSNLKDFRDALKKITIDSIYFHMYEARLRIRRGTNDFSRWLEECLEETKLANKIAAIDPYTHTLENLRFAIVKLIDKRIAELEKSPEIRGVLPKS
jgi:hypothetical protein